MMAWKVLLALLAASVLSCAAPRTSVNGGMDEGMRAMQDGRYAQAVQAFRDAVRNEPSSAYGHYYLGIALASSLDGADETPRWKAAETELRQAVSLGMRDDLLWHQLAGLYSQHDVDGGIAYLADQCDKLQDPIVVQLCLVKLLLQNGSFDGVPERLQAIRDSRPASAEARYLGALLAAERRDIDSAMEQAREAVGLDSCYAEARMLLGVALELRGEKEESEVEIARSCELKPQLRPQLDVLRTQFGALLAVRGRPDEPTAKIPLIRILWAAGKASLDIFPFHGRGTERPAAVDSHWTLTVTPGQRVMLRPPLITPNWHFTVVVRPRGVEITVFRIPDVGVRFEPDGTVSIQRVISTGDILELPDVTVQVRSTDPVSGRVVLVPSKESRR